MEISNAEQVSTDPFGPPTALSVKLRITVEPPDGAVLVYTPGLSDPVRFNGPSATHDVPTNGKVIYVQMILGAVKWSAEGLGYRDNI
jgi:hypothetical protein